jgi:hypothetical protein
MRMGWKIYFWIFTLLLGVDYFFEIAFSLGILLPDEGETLFNESWTWLDWLDTLKIGISLIGIFGLAYQKIVGAQIFWKRWFFFILIFDISYSVYKYNTSIFGPEVMWQLSATSSLAIAFCIPFYIALYVYGYKSKKLWKSSPASQ